MSRKPAVTGRNKKPPGKQQNPKAKTPGIAARETAARILTRIIDDRRPLDGLIDRQHGLPEYLGLPENDRALVRAIVNAALRHRGFIEKALARLMDRPLPKGARHLLHTLHVAVAQILFLDVPDSAAVNLAVTSVSNEQRSARFKALANAVLRRLAREKQELPDPADDPGASAMPTWFFGRLKKSYGRERANDIARAHLAEPPLDLTVKGDAAAWAERLGGQVMFNGTVRLLPQGPVDSLSGYEEGGWWVQDLAASLPVHLMGDVGGLDVLDLCAAPGGKTAQLVARGATVTAVEKAPSRTRRLEENLARLQMTADVVCADLTEWQPGRLFDAVLLDAPCSSTGTARRHPDVMWIRTPEDIAALASLQAVLLQQAATFVKPGGLLLFANCSIDRSEGEDLFAKICNQLPGLNAEPFRPEEIFGRDDLITGQGTVRTLPCHPAPLADGSIAPSERMRGMDGFFAARFRRES